GRADLTPLLVLPVPLVALPARLVRGCGRGFSRRRTFGGRGRDLGGGCGALGRLGRSLRGRGRDGLLRFRLLRHRTHARGVLGGLRPDPRARAVVGLARDLPILEIAELLLAVLAVLRVGIARLPAHGARELGAALVDPRPLAAGTAAGPFDVFERLVDAEAPLAHPVRRLGRGLAGQARVELIAARPRPGVLAARGAAAHLAVRDPAERELALVAHATRRLVVEACCIGLD